uniref:Putative secreted protein n=1 Tax=Anopheles marajoara TaxID=58244 RepID=A0A2M4C6Y2_9DIPT
MIGVSVIICAFSVTPGCSLSFLHTCHDHRHRSAVPGLLRCSSRRGKINGQKETIADRPIAGGGAKHFQWSRSDVPLMTGAFWLETPLQAFRLFHPHHTPLHRSTNHKFITFLKRHFVSPLLARSSVPEA